METKRTNFVSALKILDLDGKVDLSRVNRLLTFPTIREEFVLIDLTNG